MKKKYIAPRVNIILSEMGASLLAGSGGSVEVDPPKNPDPENPTGPVTPGGGGISDAKQNTFSTWEEWDEY